MAESGGRDAGDAIGRAVAVAVMAWTEKTIPWAYSGQVPVWHDADELPLLTCHSWRPDRDDRQCQQVLDRMVELGYAYTLSVDSGRASACFHRDHVRATREHTDRRVACLEAALDAVS